MTDNLLTLWWNRETDDKSRDSQNFSFIEPVNGAFLRRGQHRKGRARGEWRRGAKPLQVICAVVPY